MFSLYEKDEIKALLTFNWMKKRSKRRKLFSVFFFLKFALRFMRKKTHLDFVFLELCDGGEEGKNKKAVEEKVKRNNYCVIV